MNLLEHVTARFVNAKANRDHGEKNATTPVGRGGAAEATDDATPPPYSQHQGTAAHANTTSATGQDGRARDPDTKDPETPARARSGPASGSAKKSPAAEVGREMDDEEDDDEEDEDLHNPFKDDEEQAQGGDQKAKKET